MEDIIHKGRKTKGKAETNEENYDDDGDKKKKNCC